MNKTEKKAEQWLRTQGGSPIFQPRKSPDFISLDGRGYEVKLLRENTITFSLAQFRALSSFQNPLKILVFDDGEKPLHIIPFEAIAEKRYWGHIRIAVFDYEEPKSIRDLDRDLYRRARAEALKQGISIGTWISEAIAEKLVTSQANKKGG